MAARPGSGYSEFCPRWGAWFSDRRISVDEFVYELRVRCRAVGGDPERLPWLEIRVPRDGSVTPAPRVLETIRTRAFEIGVLQIEMIYEDDR